MSAIQGMGDAASMFLTPTGEFDATGNYKAASRSQYTPDAKTANTQAAINSSFAFGNVLPQQMGQLAGILPAAVKIGEMKQMQEIAEKYYEKYIKDFNRKYGFTEDQTKELINEFNSVTDEIKNLIPDKDMRNMYSKYIESYPTMYLSMIPAEALQTKLAVKCYTENQNIRKKIEDMSKCVSTLVKNLTAMQIEAGIPPIVNLMFESMPDPLTAMTDPMYHKYNEAISTYHTLLDDTTQNGNFKQFAQDGSLISTRYKAGDHIRMEPIHFLEQLVADLKGKNATEYTTGGSTTVTLELSQLSDLLSIMKNMQTQSGCQPFGNEWSHRGPTPAMNPAMCLDEKDKFQPGNPRHEQGRTQLFKAQRDPSGTAHWVPAGHIPGMSASGPQMVQQPMLPPMPQQQMGHPSMAPPMGQPPSMGQPQMGNFDVQFSQPKKSSKGGKTNGSWGTFGPKRKPKTSSSRQSKKKT